MRHLRPVSQYSKILLGRIAHYIASQVYSRSPLEARTSGSLWSLLIGRNQLHHHIKLLVANNAPKGNRADPYRERQADADPTRLPVINSTWEVNPYRISNFPMKLVHDKFILSYEQCSCLRYTTSSHPNNSL
ncbi:hypothetical protein J4E82_010715 [Alternaria postmessia]|nr:uncharacterized protein J4E82_010715 [Alternaria postmessia]KAI5368497.1 hypothetical protein J4E82_010715 [Alternaria postmessia]